ncbi:hypothetical protein C2E23DRAFT_499488 [Lenzites betulinus]|nr:hypothetical protein C2E23DRAFT_499488 [Lenzites betulinus]
MLKRGGVPDLARAAVWFIKWWREEGGLASAVNAAAPGLSVAASDELSAFTPDADLLSASAPAPDAQNQNTPDMGSVSSPQNVNQTQRRGWGFDLEWDVALSEAAAAARHDGALVQAKMEACMARFEAAAAQEEREGGAVSATQEKKRAKEAQRTRQQARSWARLAAKKGR